MSNGSLKMMKERFANLLFCLHTYFADSTNQEKIELFIERAKNENAWFSDRLIRNAMQAIQEQFFSVNKWNIFFSQYGESSVLIPQKIGLILPGNLPAVGMHDLLMTIASGHQPVVKLSSQDRVLMSMYIDLITYFDSTIEIKIQDKMSGVDAVIATGSDFSSEYFINYFAKIPHIIRKNRSSVAVLTGKESNEDYKQLASDIFMYYGLGCRNVSTIAVPNSMDLVPLFDVLTLEDWVLDHTKYSNNYQYHKTLFLLNQIAHFDLGNLIVTDNEALVSPVGVLYVHRYHSQAELEGWLATGAEKIQCIVGSTYIPFGQAQFPALDDFADGVNTYQFLTSLS
jgi:hypothetical protein